MSLDLAVSRAIMRLRLLERAVHDDGPWEIRVGDQVLQAVRIVFDDRVVFSVHFSSIPTQPMLELLCAGELVSVRPVEHPGYAPFILDWEIALTDPVGV